ncbi:MAG: hypothetical protein B7Y81_00590 [Caulobacter sp. 32-67-35]|nr:MAG: hypothetical protein B7Y81_00590 [Caulobacter sp. 32-67-35]OZA78756.1 MAG: hypothetical protein B7X77_03545 [Caulobacter sp. 39-67-4]HQR90437.1 hypothetical protein [Caulobacter sp.]
MASDNRPPDKHGARARLAEAADLRASAKLADRPQRSRALRRLAKMTIAAAAALRPLTRRRPD